MSEEELLIMTTTDTLVAELKRRHPDGCIVSLQFPEHEARSTGQGWRITFCGNTHNTLKLANIGLWMHQQAIMGQVGPDITEEPNGVN